MKGLIIINCKNYLEVAGEKILQLSEIAKDISTSNKVEIMIAPPQNSLFYLSQSVKLPLICQHVDDEKIGATTGFIIPELAKSYGAAGSLINHSEHKMEFEYIQNIVERLRQLNMTSIVCAATSQEVGKVARLHPNMIAIEPPELIGTGKAVSKVNPSIITKSVKEAGRHSKNIKVICGAGIVDKTDVQSAINLGSEGILLASGLIKSDVWQDKLIELCEGFE
ncbi:MAG TPA: triose-phosphate isomerase [Nitrososphaeraceae archaeon]|nr:triose-phosphate isomerase [Nitrososphaeraceae archaeon]